MKEVASLNISATQCKLRWCYKRWTRNANSKNKKSQLRQQQQLSISKHQTPRIFKWRLIKGEIAGNSGTQSARKKKSKSWRRKLNFRNEAKELILMSKNAIFFLLKFIQKFSFVSFTLQQSKISTLKCKIHRKKKFVFPKTIKSFICPRLMSCRVNENLFSSKKN